LASLRILIFKRLKKSGKKEVVRMGWTHKFILGGALVRGKLFYDRSTGKVFVLVRLGSDEIKISGELIEVLDKLNKLDNLIQESLNLIEDLVQLESKRGG